MDNDNQQPIENKEQSATPEEPQQPADTPETPPQQNAAPEPKKSHKLALVIVLIVMFLIAVGAAAFLMASEEDATTGSENQETTSTQPAKISPSIFSQNGDKVQYIDESGELANYTTLESNQKFIEAYTEDDSVIATYSTSLATQYGGTKYTEIGVLKDEILQKTVPLPDNVDSYSNFVLSPDKNTMVVEVGDGENDFMVNLTSVNIETGASEVIYEPETSENGFQVVVGWLDNENVLLQQQTCRQCDGPWLPILNKLNITTKQITPFYSKADSEEGEDYAAFYFSSDNSTLLMTVGDYNKLFGGDDIDTDYGPTYLYDIDMETAEAREITQFTAVYENYVGMSADGSSVYTSAFEWVETDDPNAPWQTEEGNYIQDTPKLYKVNTASGQKTEIPLESRLIKQGTKYGSVIESGDELYFTTINADGTTNESYAFSRLGSGENAVITVLSEATFTIGEGSIEIFQAAN